MINNVNSNMISRLEIVGDCDQRFPCAHLIIVTLEDRLSKRVGLASYKIDVLIKAIAHEKLVSSWKNSHFDAFKGYPEDGLSGLKFFTGKEAFPTADEILLEIFKEAYF